MSMAFQNEKHFPSFDSLPDYDDHLNSSYFREDEVTGSYDRSCHYAFLGEIIEVINFVRPRVMVKAKNDACVMIHFYPDDGNMKADSFSWGDVKVGNTIMVLYAYKKLMFDFTVGIRVEHLNSVYIFKSK